MTTNMGRVGVDLRAFTGFLMADALRPQVCEISGLGFVQELIDLLVLLHMQRIAVSGNERQKRIGAPL